MKNLAIILILLLIIATGISAQDQASIKSTLSESKTSFEADDFEDSRFKLQQALSELYVLLGKEVLKRLPEALEDAQANIDNDEVLGNPLGVTGVNVHRTYGMQGSDQPYADFNILGNSPFLSMVNSFLTNPLFMNKADGSQKVVKIHSYKALLKKEENESGEISHYEIDIPMGSSLFTMHFYNFLNESAVMKAAHEPDVPGIAKLIEGH